MTRILVTGGSGFVGHHLVDHLLKTTDWKIFLPFRHSEAGTTRLKEIGAFDNQRVGINEIIGDLDYIVHLEGTSSIARSLARPAECFHSNVTGTFTMLEFARKFPKLKNFLYFSTDEVMDIDSPYAATKSAAETLCFGWAESYGIPVLVTNCANLIGKRQAPEKFLPTVVRAGLKGETVKLFTDDFGWFPIKDFLHAHDVALALVYLLEHATQSKRYKIARGDYGVTTMEFVDMVAKIMGCPIQTRKVSGFKIKGRMEREEYGGWNPVPLEESLPQTVNWMLSEKNIHWLGL